MKGSGGKMDSGPEGGLFKRYYTKKEALFHALTFIK